MECTRVNLQEFDGILWEDEYGFELKFDMSDMYLLQNSIPENDFQQIIYDYFMRHYTKFVKTSDKIFLKPIEEF